MKDYMYRYIYVFSGNLTFLMTTKIQEDNFLYYNIGDAKSFGFGSFKRSRCLINLLIMD